MAATRKWSQLVTETSDAMDVAPGTFKQSDPKKIATALERDAERSSRRKESPYRSAMSMLTFYINRAGDNLSARQRKILEDAKDVLREQYGPKAGRSAKAAGTLRKAKPKAKSASRAPKRRKSRAAGRSE